MARRTTDASNHIDTAQDLEFCCESKQEATSLRRFLSSLAGDGVSVWSHGVSVRVSAREGVSVRVSAREGVNPRTLNCICSGCAAVAVLRVASFPVSILFLSDVVFCGGCGAGGITALFVFVCSIGTI